MTTASTPTFTEPTAEEMIFRFAKDTIDAANLLHANNLHGQMIVIIYSAIDTMGLLDAPPTQTKATGNLFKAWVRTYLLPQDASFEFNDVDLWGARCGVLHTFTAESDLSAAGTAKEVHYIGGDMNTPLAKKFVTMVRAMGGGGRHVPANFDDLFLAFCNAIKQFASVLDNNCKQNPAYEARLRKVLQQHYIPE